MRTPVLLLLALCLSAPVAAGEGNVFSDPVCVPSFPCVPPAVCLEDILCYANTCGPAATCEASLVQQYQCEDNATLAGESCERDILVQTNVSRSGASLASARAGAATGSGSVEAQHLPNTWFSDGAEAHATLLGIDAGTVGAGLYRSSVTSSNGDEVTQVGFFLGRSEGSLEDTDLALVGGVVLHEGMPRGCFVHVVPGASYDCPYQLFP